MKKSFLWLLPAIACGTEPDRTATTEDMLTALPPGTQIVWNRYISDPGVARNASAAAYTNGWCSGVMIGPSIYMTAAHCGHNRDQAIYFRAYTSATSFELEAFTCHSFANTENDTDMELFFCDPNSIGERPGDKYGYADVSYHRPSNNDPVYSIWRNTLTPPGGPNDTNVLLYSAGRVVGPNPITNWENPALDVDNPLCVDDNTPNLAGQVQVGQQTNVCGVPGSSGSAQFDAYTHLLLFGPTTGGGCNLNTGIGVRNSVNWSDWMKYGHIPDAVIDANMDGIIDDKICFAGDTPATEDDYLLQTFGMIGGDFRAVVLDRDFDAAVDIAELIEYEVGESVRDYYAPWFGSARTNTLWRHMGSMNGLVGSTPSSSVHIDRDTEELTLQDTWGPPNTTLQLPIQSEPHVVTFDVRFPSYTRTTRLDVCVPFAAVPCRSVNAQPTTQRMVWRFANSSLSDRLDFALSGPGSAVVRNLVVTKETVNMDFDQHDKRRRWVYADGSKAPILPLGLKTAGTTRPDFAGLVTHAESTAATQHNGVAFVPSLSHSVCVKTKRFGGNGANAAPKLELVGAAANVIASMDLPPTLAWSTKCLEVALPANERRADVRFTTQGGYEYLVDDLVIEVL